jgi:hypothetical protein
VVKRQRSCPAIATASLGDATLFGAGSGASALTMHAASQRASFLPSARNSWRRGHRAFFRSLLSCSQSSPWAAGRVSGEKAIADGEMPGGRRAVETAVEQALMRGLATA